jgi:hypothetical protein
MPASIIGEIILQPIFELLFHVVAYHVGCLVVPIISFGRWKCDRLLKEVPKKKLRRSRFYHWRGDQIYLTTDATSLVGLLFSGLLIGLVLWCHFSA